MENIFLIVSFTAATQVGNSTFLFVHMLMASHMYKFIFVYMTHLCTKKKFHKNACSLTISLT